MRDHVTNQPQPATPGAPSRPRPEPDEDHPPRPNGLTIWSPRNITYLIFVSLSLGMVLMIAAGVVANATNMSSVLFISFAFVLGATIGGLSTLRYLRRQIGIGIRTSDRDLPRGALGSPNRPRRPALPGTGIVANLDAMMLQPSMPPRHVSRLVGHHGRITAVAVTSNGRFALSAGKDRAVILSDVQTGFELLAFQGFQAEVRSVSFSPDGRLVAAAGLDTWGGNNDKVHGVVRIWDASTGQELRRFEIDGPLWSLAFLPDGQHLVVGGNDYLRLWEIDGPTPVAMVRVQQGLLFTEEVFAIALSPDGKMAVAGCHRSHDARLINLDQGQEIRALTGHGGGFSFFRVGAVVSAAFSPDGMRILTGSWDQTARVWNLAGNELTRFEGHRGWWGWRGVIGVAWLDSRRALSVSENGLLCVWDTDTGEEIERYNHGAGVTSLATTDGKLALTAGRDGTIRVWDM